MRLAPRLRRVLTVGLLGLAGFLLPAVASAQTSENLLLIANDNSQASVQIAEYYARKRAVPTDHVVHIKAVSTDTVSRAEFELTIQAPIAAALLKNSLQDKVLYLVLTKGIPLRIAGTDGLQGTVASVDSELTLLYQRLLGFQPPAAGRVSNPYFLNERPLADARPFTRFSGEVYLVTRLDGFTVEDTLKLIDRGAAPSREGRIVLDQKATAIDRGGDRWLQDAADRLRSAGLGDRVLLEPTRAIASTPDPVIGYYSWGSNDPANQRRRSGLQFAPGAIGGTFVSTDGRTFAEPPADWVPSDPDGRGPRFGGGFQSLAGDLIRDGITGVSGHVAEPYLDATIRPQILFPAYLAGFNLAESFYLAMPFLSWQTVIVGDPLCVPFPRKELTSGEIAKGIDPETEMPALFAERRLAILSRGGLNPAAIKLMLKFEAEQAQGRRTNLEALLTQATDLEPRFTTASMLLAEVYQSRGDWTKASDLYRRVIAVDPQHAPALNDLAYNLATHDNAPKDALPLAERAFRISPAPPIADTIGWIHHLLGDDRTAEPILAGAVAGAPGSVQILLHAAFVHAALNDTTKARAELDAAEKLDPHITDTADAKALRDRLKP